MDRKTKMVTSSTPPGEKSNYSANHSESYFWKEQSDGELLEKLFENTLLTDNLNDKEPPNFSESTSNAATVDELIGFHSIPLPPILDNISTSNHADVSTLPVTSTTVNTIISDPLLTLNSDFKETITEITNQNDLGAHEASSSLINNLLVTSDLLIRKITDDQDDEKIFKRPSSDFLASKTTENETCKKQIKTLSRNKKEDLEKSKLIKDKITKQPCGSEKNTSNGNTSKKIKRSRKRTKMINNSVTLDVSKSIISEKNVKKSLLETSAAPSNKATNNFAFKNTHINLEPSIKKFASNKISQFKLNDRACSSQTSSNIDFDLNGSFERALDSFSTNVLTTLNNSSYNNTSRRDEVDLHIKELSLLDLHSSEDDSCLELSKRNSNAHVPVITNTIKKAQPSSITSMVKKNRDHSPSAKFISDEKHTNIPVNKIMQYLSKSLETNNIPTSSSSVPCTSKNSIGSFQQKHKKNESKSICSSDWALSPPSPTNSKLKIKRKKKDNHVQPDSPLIQDSRDSTSKTELSSTSPEATPHFQLISRTHSVEPPVQHAENGAHINRDDLKSTSIENDTLQHMKNLDLNNELDISYRGCKLAENNFQINKDNLNLNDGSSREKLWSLLLKHTPVNELVQRFGAELHDKISFWDLVQLKLKHSPKNNLNTIYEIIDDYTLLYTNMSSLLERFASEQKFNNKYSQSSHKKNAENSSRSRSSSRNVRKSSISK